MAWNNALPLAIYFGTTGDGHQAHDAQLRKLAERDMPPRFPWTIGKLDGGFLTRPALHGTEGEARLTHTHGWTVLAFADRSVDHRPNSHSTYVINGTYDFAQMKAMCSMWFPEVWKRYRFEVVDARTV